MNNVSAATFIIFMYSKTMIAQPEQAKSILFHALNGTVSQDCSPLVFSSKKHTTIVPLLLIT